MATTSKKKLYERYIKTVTPLLSSSPLHGDMAEAFAKGKTKVLRVSRYESSAFDTSWVDVIEDVLFDLGEIIKVPRTITKEEGGLVPVELAKKINSESVQHLASHTQYVKSVEANGDVIPSKILSFENEDFLYTYENRFIATLIRRLVLFIEKRYEFIQAYIPLHKQELLYVKTSTTIAGEEVEIETRIKSKAECDDPAAKTAAIVAERIRKMREYILYYFSSPFMKKMKNERDVRKPIIMTNILRKNVRYHKCYEVFTFIERYDSLGMNYKSADNYSSLNEKQLKEFALINLGAFLSLQDDTEYEKIRTRTHAYKPRILSSMDDEEFVFGPMPKGPLEFVRVDEQYKDYLQAISPKDLPEHPKKLERLYYEDEYALRKNIKLGLHEIDKLQHRKALAAAKFEKAIEAIIAKREKEDALLAQWETQERLQKEELLLRAKRAEIVSDAIGETPSLEAMRRQIMEAAAKDGTGVPEEHHLLEAAETANRLERELNGEDVLEDHEDDDEFNWDLTEDSEESDEEVASNQEEAASTESSAQSQDNVPATEEGKEAAEGEENAEQGNAEPVIEGAEGVALEAVDGSVAEGEEIVLSSEQLDKVYEGESASEELSSGEPEDNADEVSAEGAEEGTVDAEHAPEAQEGASEALMASGEETFDNIETGQEEASGEPVANEDNASAEEADASLEPAEGQEGDNVAAESGEENIAEGEAFAADNADADQVSEGESLAEGENADNTAEGESFAENAGTGEETVANDEAAGIANEAAVNEEASGEPVINLEEGAAGAEGETPVTADAEDVASEGAIGLEEGSAAEGVATSEEETMGAAEGAVIAGEGIAIAGEAVFEATNEDNVNAAEGESASSEGLASNDDVASNEESVMASEEETAGVIHEEPANEEQAGDAYEDRGSYYGEPHPVIEEKPSLIPAGVTSKGGTELWDENHFKGLDAAKDSSAKEEDFSEKPADSLLSEESLQNQEETTNIPAEGVSITESAVGDVAPEESAVQGDQLAEPVMESASEEPVKPKAKRSRKKKAAEPIESTELAGEPIADEMKAEQAGQTDQEEQAEQAEQVEQQEQPEQYEQPDLPAEAVTEPVAEPTIESATDNVPVEGDESATEEATAPEEMAKSKAKRARKKKDAEPTESTELAGEPSADESKVEDVAQAEQPTEPLVEPKVEEPEETPNKPKHVTPKLSLKKNNGQKKGQNRKPAPRVTDDYNPDYISIVDGESSVFSMIPGRFIVKTPQGYYVNDEEFSKSKGRAKIFYNFNEALSQKKRFGGKVVKL